MVSSRIWIQSCLCHGTVGRTKLTGKNKTDIKINRDAKQREFSKESHNSDCSWSCLHRCHFGGFIICICIYLSLEQHRLEVHVPTYMWNFFPNKSQDVELWIWRVNSEVSNCRENREFLPLTPCCSKMNCIPSLADWIWGLCHFRHKSSS